jgi:DNA-binding ferritin-like protein
MPMLLTGLRKVVMYTERISSELQDSLIELAELASQVKQLHWNVKGRQFRPRHEQLDEAALGSVKTLCRCHPQR